MTVEEWQARMKGCQVLVSLLDRKDRSSGPHVNPKRQKRTTCLFEFDEVCDRVTNPDCLVVRSNQM